jgi:hypothetical protein
LATTLKGRPNLIRRFREGRICFVLMAYQDSVRMNQTQFENVCREVHEVLPTSSLGEVKKLVGQSLVFINRSHLHKLMGPTLAVLDQFRQHEESFGERRPGKRAEFDVLKGAQ